MLPSEPTAGNWLRMVSVCLAGAFSPSALELVEIRGAIEEPEPISDLRSRTMTVPGGPAARVTSPRAGWILPLQAENSGTLCLFAETAPEKLEESFDTSNLHRIGHWLREAWALAQPPLTASTVYVLAERDAVRKVVHDLRNHMNSLMMNAAVITQALAGPAPQFSEQIGRDITACSRLLTQLVDLFEPGAVKPPPAGY